MSGKQEISSRISYFQIANAYSGKERRQNRLRKHYGLFGSRHAQTEASFQQKKDRRRRPSLRSTGYWIKCRRLTRAPGKTAEQLWETMQIKEESGIKQTCENHRGRLLKAVSGESRGNQGVIVRPDRSV